jgi:hypothetical protein
MLPGHAAELTWTFPNFNNGEPITPLFNTGERAIAESMKSDWGAFRQGVPRPSPRGEGREPVNPASKFISEKTMSRPAAGASQRQALRQRQELAPGKAGRYRRGNCPGRGNAPNLRVFQLSAESAPSRVASGTTGVWAKAVIPLRARNSLHRPKPNSLADLSGSLDLRLP